MLYERIDGIDKPLSRLTYGTPGPAFSGDETAAFRCYDLAWEAGFRTFDTANSYGQGEATLGAWLKQRGHRDEAVILDKGCNPGQHGCPDVFSAETIRLQVEESLRRLQTDCVELYILHRDDPTRPVDPIVEILNELKQAGKILRFGGSNWTMERMQQANAYARAHGLEGFTVASPSYSLAEFMRDPWGGSVSISGAAQQPFRDYLAETKVPVFCYSSLGRGYFSGKFRTDHPKPIEECLHPAPIEEYDAPVNRARLARAEQLAAEKDATVSQIGLAWLLHQPLNLFPIVSPGQQDHICDNRKALDLTLTDQECRWLLTGV